MFTGTYTAIVTPFTETGEVDSRALAALVEFQIDGGVDGIVAVGTTGESPTLNVDEHLRVIREIMRRASGRVKVLAGTGANSTHEAIELTREAAAMGCDGTLQVMPYYNKPNDSGLLKHFTAVADIGLPVMLYNVPGRSGKAIPIPVIAELAGHPNVVAIKEAGGSVERVSQIRAKCDIDILSGDDSLTLPMMSVGAVGVVSVVSNILPAKVSEMVRLALSGRWSDALEMHDQMYDLFGTMLSLETNPVPVKTALAMMGMVNESFRLPLDVLEDAKRQSLEKLLQSHNLI